MNYGKSKGLASLRTSHNIKRANPMTKSLKLSTLMNMRKSGKGSALTKASPSMQERRNKTNNLAKVQKDRRSRGLLSFQSDEDTTRNSQDLRKKNAMLRSEIIERQKKMGKHKAEPIRSVSMVVGDEDKAGRKKGEPGNAKKRTSKKVPGSVNKKDFIQKKIGSGYQNLNANNSKKFASKPNAPQYKTMAHRNRQRMPLLNKKSQGKSYTSNNKARLMGVRQKTGAMQTMPAQKKTGNLRSSKGIRSNNKNSYLTKKQGRVGPKGRTSNSKKVKENVGSMNNIYKRSRVSANKKKENNSSIYQDKDKKVAKEYVTENLKKTDKKDKDGERNLFTKAYVTNPNENFENIYEKSSNKILFF